MPYYCATHATTPLIRTSQSPAGAPDVLTCPECTAEALDRMAAEPGTITIMVRDTGDELGQILGEALRKYPPPPAPAE